MDKQQVSFPGKQCDYFKSLIPFTVLLQMTSYRERQDAVCIVFLHFL